jgi:TonB family protein
LSSALQPPAPTPPDLPSVPADPDENLATAPQSPSAETKMAAVTPPAPVKPAPLKPQAAARPPPKLEGWPLPIGAERPRELPRTASIVGPDASRDEYCAYVLTLVMRHINLVPLSLLGARHGDTYVRIRVLQDGTVSSAQVEQGSGYADIDDKIAAMVTAAGHFPPLPQWIPGPSIDFTFHLHFPHPAER